MVVIFTIPFYSVYVSWKNKKHNLQSPNDGHGHLINLICMIVIDSYSGGRDFIPLNQDIVLTKVHTKYYVMWLKNRVVWDTMLNTCLPSRFIFLSFMIECIIYVVVVNNSGYHDCYVHTKLYYSYTLKHVNVAVELLY